MTANAAPQISIADLENVLKIIDAASERGAFKGSELSSVGSVRDKVATFLNAVAATRNETVADEPAEAQKSEKE